MTSEAKSQISFDLNILFADTHQTPFLYLWTCQQFACVTIWIFPCLCLDKIVERDVFAVVPLSDETKSGCYRIYMLNLLVQANYLLSEQKRTCLASGAGAPALLSFSSFKFEWLDQRLDCVQRRNEKCHASIQSSLESRPCFRAKSGLAACCRVWFGNQGRRAPPL